MGQRRSKTASQRRGTRLQQDNDLDGPRKQVRDARSRLGDTGPLACSKGSGVVQFEAGKTTAGRSATGKKATYADLLQVPDHLVAEIVDGELVASPRPALPHALASSALGSDLFGRFHRGGGPDHPGGWWILDEPELHLGEDVLVPDLAGWRRERVPRLPNAAYFGLAPDWVCEIVSPASARLDRVSKANIYAREGVGWLWIVEPLAQTLEVFRLEQGQWVRLAAHAGAGRVRAEPFDAVELEMRHWWIEEPAEE
jgi:Uma2 family endonuclease